MQTAKPASAVATGKSDLATGATLSSAPQRPKRRIGVATRTPQPRQTWPQGSLTSPQEKILATLAEYEYLTAEQLTRLWYAPTSLTHVRDLLRAMRADSLVLALPGQSVILPKIYTLSAKGSSLLGKAKRVRPSEAYDLTQPFLAHTLAVNDVVIRAVLLAREESFIELTRVIHERELRGIIKAPLVPDAAVEFLLRASPTERYRYFYHVEVYRHLPKKERFQKKVFGYVDFANAGQQEHFGTRSLMVAVFCAEAMIAKTLKTWTEEALTNQREQGQRFFFGRIAPAKSSPTELYLRPLFTQAFSATKTPLLWREEGGAQ